jgi:uncharacterized membrane protein
MKDIVKYIEVGRPVRTVYNQYTQFEEFPRFMKGVASVKQLNDKMLHWVTEIGGVRREFDAEITEQIPDKRIAWRSVDGKTHGGVVTFHRISDEETRVTMQMSYDPEGFTENVADVLGVISNQVQGDLERFKEFIESRGHETGAWRGEVRAPGESR